MKPFTLIVTLALVALPLAGCVGEEESTPERTRGMVVSVPEGVDRIQVEVIASSEDTARVQLEIEEENGTDIAEDNFEVSGDDVTRVLEADIGDRTTVAVLVTVASGDAVLSVTVRGLRDAEEPVLIRHEMFVMHEEPASSTPTPTPTTAPDEDATPTPTPTEATPTPTPTGATPTPSPTPEANETTEGNTTNETNSTP